MLLSQDEARFPMVPTLRTTLGVKGHRPVVGTGDDKRASYVFGALNLVSGRLTTRLVDLRPKAKRPEGVSKNRVMQAGFVAHLHDIARRYPAQTNKRVVLVIDNAPWHGGPAVREALAAHPHLELYRLPSDSPQLHVIECFWRILRRRATHNRLFTRLSALRSTLRNNLRYYQAMKRRVLSLIESPRKRAKVAGA